ncbi:HAD family hydrolase [Roseomonas elaeocarpi]|uniref:phosphoglycolate phosphatase n=1 Tax=Roseomonas elaeocarpi TaxID=907779 RepID=A0ABV6JPY2_9PROT
MERICLLDLDGTLLDSAPDIRGALNRLMERHGMAGFTLPEVHRMIGNGVKVTVEQALAARDRPFEEALLSSFVADYEAHASDETRPFPGVLDALEALRAEGWRLAVCTNKPVRAARIVLEGCGLLPLLDAVAGGDSFAVRKPDPGHLIGTLAMLELPPEAAGGAVMVGDHSNDVRSARAAGVRPVFAAWGYGPPEMAEGAPVAQTPAELPAILRGLAPR